MTEEDFKTWAHMEYVHHGVMTDQPRLIAMLQNFTNNGKKNAEDEGYIVSDQPTITAEHTVWVEDWSKDGPAYVGMEHARLAGLNPDDLPPGPVIIKLEWQIMGRRERE